MKFSIQVCVSEYIFNFIQGEHGAKHIIYDATSNCSPKLIRNQLPSLQILHLRPWYVACDEHVLSALHSCLVEDDTDKWGKILNRPSQRLERSVKLHDLGQNVDDSDSIFPFIKHQIRLDLGRDSAPLALPRCCFCLTGKVLAHVHRPLPFLFLPFSIYLFIALWHCIADIFGRTEQPLPSSSISSFRFAIALYLSSWVRY